MRAAEVEPLYDETEVELIDGIEVPKMSPMRRHSVLQTVMGGMLRAWAGDTGTVGTEWRFHVKPGRGKETSLVPDVAYVRRERLLALSDKEAEEPPFAPDVAVEIRSPGDRERNVQRKIERYLERGGRLVLDVRPDSRTIVAHDKSGPQLFHARRIFRHAKVPGFRFSVAAYFAAADLKRERAKA